MELQELVPSFGAFGRVVLGLDVARGLDESELQWLERALFEHGLLLLRQQRLTPELQIALAKQLGQVDCYDHGPRLALPPELYSSSNVAGRGLPGYSDYWHQDGLNFETLPLIAIYHMIDVPTDGAATLFQSAERALQSMPPLLRGVIAQRSLQAAPGVNHAMVQQHAVTGRTVPCIRTVLAGGVVGLPRLESRAFLQRLEGFLDAESQIYRHAWQPGDVVLTDNASVLHKAERSKTAQPRTIHRVTVNRLRAHAGGAIGDRVERGVGE